MLTFSGNGSTWTFPQTQTEESRLYTMFKFSTILSGISHFFKGVFSNSIATLEASAKAELATIEEAVILFAKTDLGKLAIDAVALVPSGQSNGASFSQAKATFIADAKTAGHDLATIGGGVVDWMVQTAYTYSAGILTQVAAQAAKGGPSPL